MKKLFVFLLVSFALSSCSYFSSTNEEDLKDDLETIADVEPTVDLEAMMKRIVYPFEARALGIEGKVVVRALVSKNGDVIKTKILSSDSKLLEEAAIDVIKETKFTPAREKGKPTPCWVAIPIQFRLK